MARTGLQIRQGVGLPGSENGSASGGSGTMNGALNGSQQTESQYTLPGVLHYLNQEHRRFETQRNYWEIERAKLKVSSRVAVAETKREVRTSNAR